MSDISCTLLPPASSGPALRLEGGSSHSGGTRVPGTHHGVRSRTAPPSTGSGRRGWGDSPVRSWKLPLPKTSLLSGTLVGTTRVCTTDQPCSACTSAAASATCNSKRVQTASVGGRGCTDPETSQRLLQQRAGVLRNQVTRIPPQAHLDSTPSKPSPAPPSPRPRPTPRPMLNRTPPQANPQTPPPSGCTSV